MDWYGYFFERAEECERDEIPIQYLFYAFVTALAESELSTKDDLRDAIRAYEDYKKGVRYNERTSNAVSAG